MEDITKTGVQGLKGLKGLNRDNIDVAKLPEVGVQRTPMTGMIGQDIALQSSTGNYGSSMFDPKVATLDQLNNLGDVRAEEQPWYAKLGAGVAKGAVLAGTTFLDGTLGLAIGIGSAIDSEIKGEDGSLSKLWNNPFSQAMKAINEESESILPNYYSKAEQEDPFYKHIFTANFIGDKFIKNLGFTVGAMYSGGVASKALKVSKIPSLVAKVTGSTNAPAVVSTGVGAFISALNEGRVEALNNSTEWYDFQKAKLDDAFNARKSELASIYKDQDFLNSALILEDVKYKDSLAKLEEYQAHMGNMDMMLNLPILTASNVFQFGKFFANGFKTASKASNIVGKAGSYSLAPTSKTAQVLRASLNPLSEGVEEISQKAASLISGDYYGDKFQNFYRSKIDPEAEAKSVDWIKSFAQGINETVNDSSSWEEFFIGYLTGFMGIPTFGKSANSGADTWVGKDKQVGITGGFLGELNTLRQEQNTNQEIVDNLNARVQSPEFINYYQGLIRHNKYQQDMDNAVLTNDEFEFKNAEQSQLISDIIMFDNAGKLDDLKAIITTSEDYSDENIASILENTTTEIQDNNGKTLSVGPFVDANGSPMSNEDIVNKIKQNISDVKTTLDSYVKTKNDIDYITQHNLNDDQLAELTWLKMKQEDWISRAESIAENTKPVFGSLIKSLSSVRDALTTAVEIEGSINKDATEAYDKGMASIENANTALRILESLSSKSNEGLAATLTTNDNIISYLQDLLDASPNITSDVINSFNKNVSDLKRIKEALGLYENRFNEYLSNPSKLQEDISETTEVVRQDVVNNVNKVLEDKLSMASNSAKWAEILDSEKSPSEALEFAESIASESTHARNYVDKTKYANKVKNNLLDKKESGSIPTDVFDMAWNMLNSSISESENMYQVANPNNQNYFDPSIYLNETELEDPKNISLFEKAQYALITSIVDTNNTDKYKSQFNSIYRAKPKSVNIKTSTETTGESKTTSVPPVVVSPNEKKSDKSLDIIEMPVGEGVQEDIVSELTNINSIEEKPILEDNTKGSIQQYYKSAIPQLHIAGRKSGDFRPWNVVMKETTGGDYDILYNYLKDKGSFDYVNNGNLKEGDTIEFMIDPAYEAMVSGQTWHTEPTIFMVHNGQVVGVTNEGYKAKEAFGLEDVRKRVIDEYSKTDKTSQFISKTTKTSVAQMMVGVIPYTDAVLPISSKQASTNNQAPVFGIVKNGVLTTNGHIQDADIIKPMDMNGKEGNLYLLIPNGAGSYSPARLLVKHFNESEFNPSNVEVRSSSVYKGIYEALDDLSKATNSAEVGSAMGKLKRVLFIGHIDVSLNSGIEGRGSYIAIKKAKLDKNNRPIINPNTNRPEYEESINIPISGSEETVYELGADNKFVENTSERLYEDVLNDLMEAFIGLNLPIQVSTSDINTKGYNESLLDSGVLLSNIDQARTESNWFVTNPISADGKEVKAVAPAKKNTTTPTSKPVSNDNSTAIIGKTQTDYKGVNYYVDLSAKKIYDKNGVEVQPDGDTEILTSVYLDSVYGGESYGLNLYNNVAYLPKNDTGFDRTKKQFISKEELDKLKLDLKITKPVEKESIPNTSVTNDSSYDIDNSNDPNYLIDGGVEGLVVMDDKIVKTIVLPIGEIADIPVMITKVPVITQGLSGKEKPRVAFNDWYIALPNGYTQRLTKNSPTNTDIDAIKDSITKALSGNPDKLKSLAEIKTILTQNNNVVEKASVEENVAVYNNETEKAAMEAQSKLNKLQETDEEFEEEFELYRKVDSNKGVIDINKELDWLNKVLPQLSKNELVQIQDGLIQAGSNGAMAWGRFKDGMVTISNIAAAGTVYHEAFHVVFNSLLNDKQKQDILNEAKVKYGNIDNLSLEEELAEGFREYVMTQSKEGLGHKILNFFKNLFAKVTNWNNLNPIIDTLYRNINEGKYSTQGLKDYSNLGSNNIKILWHSSDYIIEKFNSSNENGFFHKEGGSSNAIFFADRAPESQSFLSNRKYKMKYNVNLGNSMIVEGVTKGKKYNQSEKHKLMQEAISNAEKNGYDSVIFKDLYDNMMYGDVYVMLSPLNIEYVKNQSNTFEGYGENQFKDLPKEQWKSLVQQGWTEEMFNSVSQEERDQAIKCLNL